MSGTHKKIKELTELCLKEGLMGVHAKLKIDGNEYYANFDFSLTPRCEKCGQIIKS